MEVKLKRASNFLRSGLASCLLLSPTLVAALGLGNIEHDSWLGDPLRAQIEVLDPKREYNPEDLRLRQIYPEEAAELGVDVVAIRLPLRTKIERVGDKLVIQLSTNRPVSEPFLNFMLALEWPKGKSYREYSLLLDPKGQQIIAAPVVQQPAQAATNSGGARPVLINEGQANRPAASSSRVIAQAAPIVPVSSGENAEYWRVRPGQTLSQIAQKVRIDSNIQLQAVTNHLYRSNPQAFEGGIDQLQVGARLRLPGKIEYAQMPRWRDEPVAALQGIEPAPRQAAPQRVDNSNAKVDYTVQPGDTLSQVAQKMRQDPNISLQKVIDDIYQQNPDAFAGGMNQLRVGAKLELRGEAAVPSRALSMNSVDVSDVSPELPSAEDFNNAAQQASDSEVSGRLRLSDAPLSEEQILNGDLPTGDKLPVNQQIQMVSELTDKLNLENRDLRQRIDAVEGDDSVALLQELVLLQSKQIEHFQQQLQQTLSMLEKQKGNGSLDASLAGLNGAASEQAGQNDNTESSASNDSVSDESASNELLTAENVNEAEVQNTESLAGETAPVEPSAASDNNKEVAEAPANTNNDQAKDIYEGQGVGAQLADRASENEATAAAQPAANDSSAKGDSDSRFLWLGLILAAVLAGLAWLDFRRPGGFLNRFNKTAEDKQEPSIDSNKPAAPAEPVVRVRKREELEAEEPEEPIVQVPLAPVEEEPVADADSDIEPLISGVARWNRKDIPMLQVEESELGELPNEDNSNTDDSLHFDDFGLMNTISIDDLDIDLDEGLDQGFKLDLDDEEDEKQSKA
ncbi:LysM peptidoglycan-binding domain-containing protein [uncultured Pseudoteredinibacter sp.]|uniref:FimV/HubP-related protein n=1 Tax=uncultured Pseudoteredinibacter sp. TaxID=1641701 RepID=UPI002639A28E|nr:LysM peptidoglycan-binding domain-containing protein [uncultured Pseudoteredinibacter sp.]